MVLDPTQLPQILAWIEQGVRLLEIR